MFHFVNNTSNKTPEHLLCSDLTWTPFFNFLLWKLAFWCFVFSPGHPEHPEHTRTPPNPPQKNTFCVLMTPEHPLCSILKFYFKIESWTPFVFNFETYTFSMRSEHLLCSDLTWIPFFNFLVWKLAVRCFVLSPGHPEHPEHSRTPQIPLKRTPFEFWWHQNTLCVPFWNLYF